MINLIKKQTVLLSFAAFLCFANHAVVSGQRGRYKEEYTPHALIVSPSSPRDSRGETVYEGRGESQAEEPAVSGIFRPPATIKVKYPKCPKSLKDASAPTEVIVHGVISAKGDLIDAEIDNLPGLAADVVQNTRDVLPYYRFKPATLDGLPIAMKAKVVVTFETKH